MVSRSVKESDIRQGQDEEQYYFLTTTPWASAPTAASVTAWDVTDSYTDVTSTVLSGAASISGDIITLPKLSALTAEHTYRIEVKFVSGSNTYEAYGEVLAER